MRLIDVNKSPKPTLLNGKAGQDDLEILETLAVFARSTTGNGMDAVAQRRALAERYRANTKRSPDTSGGVGGMMHDLGSLARRLMPMADGRYG
jgi:hypothetical protein